MNLHNFTGHVLRRRGLFDLLVAVDQLEDQMTLEELGQPAKWEKGIIVHNVECQGGEKISVIINRHGIAEHYQGKSWQSRFSQSVRTQRTTAQRKDTAKPRKGR